MLKRARRDVPVTVTIGVYIMGFAYNLTTNDGGGRNVIVTIYIDTGDGTFLNLYVEDEESGEELLDLIGTDEAIRGFFAAVEEARQAWLKVRGNASDEGDGDTS